MKEISKTEAARILGVKSSRWQAQIVNEKMTAYGYKFANKAKVHGGTAYSYWEPEVRDVAKKEAEKARAARAAAAPAPTKQQPQQEPLRLEDDDIKEIKRLLEGHTSYACRTGDEVAKLSTKIERLESSNRILVIALNRLLKAASLQLVPEIGANGVTHAAPEARQ